MPWGAGLAVRAPRLASLLLAAVISLGLFLFPYIVGPDRDGVRYLFVVLAIAGARAGFVHSVGFVPETPALRWMLGPWFAWPAMAGGGAAIVLD
jgi:predicted membrane protein